MRRILFGLLVLLGAANASAATLTVGPGKTYATIQAAVNAAGTGDTISIDPVAFQECVTLPVKAIASPIIIRSATANGNLPAAGVRIDPSYTAVMPTITACAGGAAAFTTANGAHDYQLGPGLHFTSTPGGFNQILALGTNGTSQQFEADQPYNITVDRNWVDGDSIVGQKVGIDMNGKNIQVINNYIDDIFAVSQDAIGVRCVNGTGPYVVQNNYISAGAQGFLCGGDDPQMYSNTTVDAATTTSATLNSSNYRAGHSVATLRVGQLMAFLGSGGTQRYHTYVRSCGTSTLGATCSSNSVTFDAIAVAPDTGATSDVRWGAIPNDIKIRRNYFFKPLTWQNPILGANGTVTPTGSTASGSLPAGTYFYRVLPLATGYNNNTIYGTASAETVACTIASTGQCSLAWTAVTSASKYRVFRTTTSGTYASGYFEVSSNSATDTGQTLTAASGISNPTYRVIKNMFEIKFGTNYQIDSNYFKNAWVGSDIGYGLWLKSNNSGGKADFAQTKNVVFEYNLIESTAGCFNILGRIDTTASDWSAYLENLTIRQNVCSDSNSNYLTKTGGGVGSTTYAIKIQSPIKNLLVENNTFIHTMRGSIYFVVTGTQKFEAPVFRNNIFLQNTYGLFGASCTEGLDCMTQASISPVFTGNGMEGSASGYPTGNTYITNTVFIGSTNFNNYASNDFSLKVGSPFKGVAVGGGDPGANIALVTTATTGVTTGAAEGTNAPNITTAATLTPGTQGSAYSVTLAVTGGTSTYTWAVAAGSTLPTGLSLSSGGVLSGTPTVPGSYSFSIRVTDSTAGTALTDTQTFTLVIAPTSSTLNILTTVPNAGTVAQPYSMQLVVSGGTPPYVWDVSSGSLPSWATLSSSGLLEGIPNLLGGTSFTVRVTDATTTTDTQALTLIVSGETLPCSRQQRMRQQGVTLESSVFRRPVPPSASAPDCATRGDLWIDTSSNRLYRASNANPLTWSFDAQGSHNLLSEVHVDTVPAAPAVGDMLVLNDDGLWAPVNVSQLAGLSASAITSGTLDISRLPARSQNITLFAGAPLSNTNASVSGEEFHAGSRNRIKVDLLFYTQIAMTAHQTNACGTGGSMEIQYSLDNSAWVTTGLTYSCASGGFKDTAFVTLPVAARVNDVYLRAFYTAHSGAGTEDPSISSLQLRFR